MSSPAKPLTRLQTLIREKGLIRTIPQTTGDVTGQSNTTNLDSIAAHDGTGQGTAAANAIALDDTYAPPENERPWRRQFHRMTRAPWPVKLARRLWALRPWRKLTSEEELERQEIKARKEQERLLLDESKILERRLINALTRLGICYRYPKSQQDFLTSGISEVRFEKVFSSPEGHWYKVDTRRLPRGVGIMDMVQEHVLSDLSLSCAHQVNCQYSPDKGVWYIVERAGNLRAIPNYVKYSDCMARMPKTADRFTIPLGVGVNQHYIYESIVDMPHLLVAGATQGGKSNFINAALASLIQRNTPETLQFIMVDLKGGLEFTFFEELPHLLKVPDVCPKGIIYEREDVPTLLEWIIAEGEKRMGKIKKAGHKKISEYNRNRSTNRLPLIFLVVDEWADIALFADLKKTCNELLGNIIQKMRAVGIHVILATQYPSAQVLDTLIRVNMPAKAVFNVDQNGSQIVLGNWNAFGLSVQGRFVFKLGVKEFQVQAPHMPDSLIRQIVQNAIEGKTEAVIEQLSPEEIMGWALEFNGGSLGFNALWGNFKGRIAKETLLAWLNEWDGQVFTIHERDYLVEPSPGGTRPRRLVFRDNTDSAPSTIS